MGKAVTADGIFADIQQLDDAGRERLAELIGGIPDRWRDKPGWGMLLLSIQNKVARRERSKRSRKEDVGRNDLIRSEAANGLSHKQIASKLAKTHPTACRDLTAEAVRKVLARSPDRTEQKRPG